MDTGSEKLKIQEKETIYNNLTIPFKKRRMGIPSNSRHNTPTDSNSVAHYFHCELPDEIMLIIFRHLYEDDLCRIAQVCKRFQRITNDNNLWKKLYQSVFEYTLPLFHTERCRYDFTPLEECEHHNPWKESFRQLKRRSLHVRPHYNGTAKDPSREMPHFDTLQGAIEHHIENYCSKGDVTIFIHTGIYKGEFLVVDSDLTILGAASGNVAESVVLECENKTIATFVEGAKNAYLGYVTLKFCPNDNFTDIHDDNFCLEVCENCSPTIEHCIFRNRSFVGAAVCVSGVDAKPWIRHCDVSDCENVGMYITNHAQGTFEDNEICRNALSCVKVSNHANPVMRRNNIHHGKSVGIFILNNGLGFYESNDVHHNCFSGFDVRDGSNPSVVKCTIHHGLYYGIVVHENGLGIFTDNQIHSNHFSGIGIISKSNPTIQRNDIYHGQTDGVYVSNEGRGVIEHNNIYCNKYEGINIRTKSDPIVRHNRIHHGLSIGVFVQQNSAGLVEENEVFENKLSGITIASGSKPVLRRNHIHSEKKFGVYFFENANGILEDNNIFGNAISNVHICTGSNPIVKGNKIWGGLKHGVTVYDGGLGVLEQNNIYRNIMSDLLISTDSNPTLKQNMVEKMVMSTSRYL